MTLEDLIEKITDIKKAINEFANDVFEFDDKIIDDMDCKYILESKENAYKELIDIKDCLERIMNEYEDKGE